MRLKMLVAFPIDSLEIGSIVIVVRGTKSIAKPAPWINCGQK
jgi:hypothetical protein